MTIINYPVNESVSDAYDENWRDRRWGNTAFEDNAGYRTSWSSGFTFSNC